MEEAMFVVSLDIRERRYLRYFIAVSLQSVHHREQWFSHVPRKLCACACFIYVKITLLQEELFKEKNIPLIGTKTENRKRFKTAKFKALHKKEVLLYFFFT